MIVSFLPAQILAMEANNLEGRLYGRILPSEGYRVYQAINLKRTGELEERYPTHMMVLIQIFHM
ncbi:MAG: hypothetical protein EOO88_59680 [Pedobacter sp.]|nr:MAG: hypothetical protein EOO88_59680 [Pedobacter sp.]